MHLFAMHDKVECKKCGFQAEVKDEPLPNSCPICGSMPLIRHILYGTASIGSFGVIHDSVEIKAKNHNLVSKKKLRKHIKAGTDLYKKMGTYVYKYWLLDRDNNRYVETVIDLVSSGVIHHCDEPLSEHIGHGSAKNQPKIENEQSNL